MTALVELGRFYAFGGAIWGAVTVAVYSIPRWHRHTATEHAEGLVVSVVLWPVIMWRVLRGPK